MRTLFEAAAYVVTLRERNGATWYLCDMQGTTSARKVNAMKFTKREANRAVIDAKAKSVGYVFGVELV